MNFSIEQITGLIGGGIVALIGFVFQGFSKRLDAAEEAQDALTLHVANQCVKKEDLKEAMKPIFHKLDKIEDKVSQTNYELAHKADRT